MTLDPNPVPEQWKPENQDESVAGYHYDQYGQKVDTATGKVLDGPQNTLQQLADGGQAGEPAPTGEETQTAAKRSRTKSE